MYPNNLISDSFSIRSTSKFNDISHSSFESIDFVKKISPQIKYDLQQQSDQLQLATFQSESNSPEFLHEFIKDEFLTERHKSCPSPVEELNYKFENTIFSDYANRRSKALKKPFVKSSGTITIHNKPQKNNLTKSIEYMTINKLNETIENHIDELCKSAKSIKRRKETVNDLDMVKYLQMTGIRKKVVSPKLVKEKKVPVIVVTARQECDEDKEEEDVVQEVEEKVSSVNDKLYLDIFIPCIN